jgi:hypothetical protein
MSKLRNFGRGGGVEPPKLPPPRYATARLYLYTMEHLTLQCTPLDRGSPNTSQAFFLTPRCGIQPAMNGMHFVYLQPLKCQSFGNSMTYELNRHSVHVSAFQPALILTVNNSNIRIQLAVWNSKRLANLKSKLCADVTSCTTVYQKHSGLTLYSSKDNN